VPSGSFATKEVVWEKALLWERPDSTVSGKSDPRKEALYLEGGPREENCEVV